MAEGSGNGYEAPFKQLLEVTRDNVRQSTEQTMLLRQVLETMKAAEARGDATVNLVRAELHEASQRASEVVKEATDAAASVVLMEIKGNEAWWRRAVWLVGILATLGGVGSFARVLQVLTTGH